MTIYYYVNINYTTISEGIVAPDDSGGVCAEAALVSLRLKLKGSPTAASRTFPTATRCPSDVQLLRCVILALLFWAPLLYKPRNKVLV